MLGEVSGHFGLIPLMRIYEERRKEGLIVCLEIRRLMRYSVLNKLKKLITFKATQNLYLCIVLVGNPEILGGRGNRVASLGDNTLCGGL